VLNNPKTYGKHASNTKIDINYNSGNNGCNFLNMAAILNPKVPNLGIAGQIYFKDLSTAVSNVLLSP